MNEQINSQIIILKEYELRRKELGARFDHMVQAFGFVLGGLAVAYGFAVKEDNALAFYLLFPWFTAFMIAVAGVHFTVVSLDISYLKDLEARLKILDYERCITEHFWRRRLKNPLSSFIVLIYFFVVVANLYPIYRTFKWAVCRFNPLWPALIFSGAPIFLSLVGVALWWWGSRYSSHNKFTICRRYENNNFVKGD